MAPRRSQCAPCLQARGLAKVLKDVHERHAVHHGCEHSHIIRGRAFNGRFFFRKGCATNEVSATDDHYDLSFRCRHDFMEFFCKIEDKIGINAKGVLVGKLFTRELEEDAFRGVHRYEYTLSMFFVHIR